MADYAAVFYLLIYLAILLLEGLCTAFYHSFEAISEMDFEELKEKHHHLAVLEKLYENKPRKMMQSYQFITIGFALFSGVLSLKFFQMNFTAYIGIKQDFLITLCVYASLLVFTAISVFLPYSLATHLPGKFLVKQSYIFRFFEICFCWRAPSKTQVGKQGKSPKMHPAGLRRGAFASRVNQPVKCSAATSTQ